MYRITNVNTTDSTIMDEIIYVRMGENGWEFYPTKDEEGNPIDPAEVAEYISVPDYLGEDKWGVCRLDRTLAEGEESEYPVVCVVPDNGLAVAELRANSQDNTVRIADVETGTVELDVITNEIMLGLAEGTETTIGMIEELAARVQAFAERIQALEEEK